MWRRVASRWGIGARQPARDHDVRRRHVAGRESGSFYGTLPDPASAAEAGIRREGASPSEDRTDAHRSDAREGVRITRARAAVRRSGRGIADEGVDRSRTGNRSLRTGAEGASPRRRDGELTQDEACGGVGRATG
jgi:hypothetical protein